MEISKIAVRVTFPNIKADPLRAAQSVPGVESNRSFPRRRNVPQKTFIVFGVRCYEWDYWSIGFQLFCLAWRNQKPWTWADWRKQWRAEDSWRKWRETEQDTSRTRREPSIKRVSAPVCRFSKFLISHLPMKQHLARLVLFSVWTTVDHHHSMPFLVWFFSIPCQKRKVCSMFEA